MTPPSLRSTSERLPWFALLFVGILLTPFMAWLLVAWSTYRAGRLWSAASIAAGCVFAGAGLYIAGNFLPIEADRLDVAPLILNAILSGIAGVVQTRLLGPWPGEPLFRAPWRSMVAPLIVSACIGFFAAVAFAIPLAIGEELKLMGSQDVLDRASVLLSFLTHGVRGIPVGLCAGIWWCARADRFGIKTVTASLFGSALGLLAAFAAVLLFSFVMHGGYVARQLSSDWWSLSPPWRAHTLAQSFGVYSWGLSMGVIGLLFGTPTSVREFWRRSALPFIAAARTSIRCVP